MYLLWLVKDCRWVTTSIYEVFSQLGGAFMFCCDGFRCGISTLLLIFFFTLSQGRAIFWISYWLFGFLLWNQVKFFYWLLNSSWQWVFSLLLIVFYTPLLNWLFNWSTIKWTSLLFLYFPYSLVWACTHACVLELWRDSCCLMTLLEK